MKICKTKLIPCPAVLTEWSELPCMWSQEQCDTWQKRVPTLPFQDKNGNLFKADLCEISRKAKELFDAGYKEVNLTDIHEFTLQEREEEMKNEDRKIYRIF